MTTLRNKTIRGAGWMAFSQSISQVARIGFMIALARLLSPAEFGLWGMALVFTGFASLLGDIGLGAALVQRSVIEPRHLNTAFWINLGMGLFLTLLMIALAVPLSSLYHAQNLAPILAIASIEFTIKGVVVVHRVLLIREMNFRVMAIQETVALVIGGMAACVLAFYGWGTWSLVAQNIIASLIIAAWIIRILPWRPAFQFDTTSLKELLQFSLNLQGFNLLNYWLRNLDKFLIGRLLGEASLGFYTRAYNTMLMPQSHIIGTLERVMWPALARCAQDADRLRNAYLRSLMMICFIGLPCMAGLAVTAGDFVVSLFGEAWSPSIVTLQWLCLAGFVQTPVATLGWLYLATGRTRRLLAWSLISCLIIIPAMIAGALSGSIERMAMWYAIGTLIQAPLGYVFAAPIATVKLSGVVRTILPSAAASIAMAILVFHLQQMLPAAAPMVRLLTCIGAGAIVYILFMFRSDALSEIVSIIKNRKNKTAS